MDWTMATNGHFPNITEWMENQTIFITGVSGFIGKVLLYKLLKSCSNVNQIYVLMRPKKGKTMPERLDELLSKEIFQEFRTKNPEVLTKVEGIAGDLCSKKLGIKASDWRSLRENVTLVFHVAASVRFDDSLQKAIFTNLRSTKYALLLAKEMNNLKAFVHVSTAYTNCRFKDIPEKVVPTEFDPEKMITIAEKIDEHGLEVLSERLLSEGYPNTYIFTKNLAENLVYQQRTDLPVVIIRPTIVVSSTKEPKPGWCDSVSSITALLAAGGKGVYRVSFCDPNNFMDYVTVDACVNTMIAAAWYRNQSFSKRENQNQKIVFNVTDVRTTNDNMIQTFASLQYIYPLRDQLWKGFTVFVRAHWYLLLMTFLLHIIPGVILDVALKIKGRKPFFMRLYRKLYLVSLALKPFTFQVYTFNKKNFETLKTIIPKEEREIFFVESIFETTLEKYMVTACLGGRQLVGDPPEVFKEDIDRVHRLYWIDMLFRLIILGLFIWILPLQAVFNWTLNKMNEYKEFFNTDL